jgi:MraZ protein
MMTGEFRAALDEKGRLLIPTKLRSEIVGDTVVLTKSVDHCLWLFTTANWEVFSKSLQESIGMFSQRDLMIQRRIIGSAMELEVDKAGRIGISALQREYAGLSKDCLVMGLGNFVEIWDEEAYMAYSKATEETFGPAVQSLNLSPWAKE